MFPEIAYHTIFGKPIVFIAGLISFISMIITAIIPLLIRRRVMINMKYHSYIAAIAIIFAIIHVVLAL